MTTTSTTARMASIWRASRGLERCPPLPPRGPPHSAPGDRRAAALRSPAPRVAGEGGAGACVHPPRCASATGAPCRGARGPARARRAPPERAPAPSRRCSLARTGGRADQTAGERARAARLGQNRRPVARTRVQVLLHASTARDKTRHRWHTSCWPCGGLIDACERHVRSKHSALHYLPHIQNANEDLIFGRQ